MSPARAARLALAVLAMTPPATLAARSSAAPVPYSVLVKHEGDAPAPDRSRPRPRPTPRPAAPATAGTAAGLPTSTPPAVGGGTPPPIPSGRPAGPGAGALPARAPDAPARAEAASPGTPAASAPRPVASPAPGRSPAAAAPAPAGARLAAGAALPAADAEAFVDGLVRQAGVERPLAGVAVAVVPAGQVVLERGYGPARPGAAVDARATLFRLGSVSKVFTWIEVLKAVEAGRLRLDDPVNTRLPQELAVPTTASARPCACATS